MASRARTTKVGTSLVVCAALLLGLSGTARADDTVATFAVTAAGSLGISVPSGDNTTPADLGSVASGNLVYAPSLGTVTVTDDRAALVADWTMTATGTHFDLQGGSADPAGDVNQRVLNSVITYTAVPSVDTGTGVATPTAGTLAAGATVAYVGTGSNEVSWNPTVSFVLLATQVAGTYKGTITHSVI